MKARDVSYVCLFAALTAALGLFPAINLSFIPVPVTAQTLGVMLAGSILGARRGALSMLVFLAVVALGVPALAGGRGGLGVFLGPSGGFLLGWPLGAFVTGLLTERSNQRYRLGIALACNFAGGILVIYASGVPWTALVAGIGLKKAALGSLIFVPGDLLKVVMASSVAVTVRRAYPVPER